MSVFRFKQFSVKQDASAMKVGTDSVILGCLAQVNEGEYMLDIGAGTGILSLMLAQRNPKAKVTSVEIDADAYHECVYNINASPFNNRIQVVHQSILDFALKHQQHFQVIISNPPYYEHQSQYPASDYKRTLARHTSALTFHSLLKVVQYCLTDNGVFWCVLPVNEMKELIAEGAELGLFPYYQYEIYPFVSVPPNRMIVGFCRKEVVSIFESLVLYEKPNQPTLAYKLIAQDFYTGHQFNINP
jgi:tRNA1Val (adenine37-N6)-methyltransferase